jgi:hypothetical protein
MPHATDRNRPRASDAVETEVAITGSPNTVNELHFDVRAAHLRLPLLGALLAMDVPVLDANAGGLLLVLGQVTSIRTENRWHEEASLKNYIKLRGRLPHLTEIGDITLGTLQTVGAYRALTREDSSVYQKVRLPIPPGSGLPLRLVNKELICGIMQGEFGYAYLGKFYGSLDVPAPVYVRHFGEFEERGSGEAYMGGIFGPSGSGKSVIAASLMALWSPNPKMGLLVLDPQSEFSSNSLARGTGFRFDFHEVLEAFSGGRFNRDRDIIALDMLRLEGAELFVQVLREKGFFKSLGVSDGKLNDVCEYVTVWLEELQESELWSEDKSWDSVSQIEIKESARARGRGTQKADGETISFKDGMIREIVAAFAVGSRGTKEKEFSESWERRSPSLSSTWDATVSLFADQTDGGEPRVSLSDVLQKTVMAGRVYILDLNPEKIAMQQRLKLYLMDFIFRRLRGLSHLMYRMKRPGNSLIVLDEAGRFIPQDTGNDALVGRVCKSLTDSVKELRKMRCGFLFITQTIAEIQKEIYRNLHFRVYGVGLGVGADADHITSREGPEAFELYRSLPDPRLSGSFSFMVAGVLVALGSSGRPMIIEGFRSDAELLTANAHLVSETRSPGSGQEPEMASAEGVQTSAGGDADLLTDIGVPPEF